MIPVRKFLKNPLVKRWWFVGLLGVGGAVGAYLLYKRGKAVQQAGAANGNGGTTPPPQVTHYGPGYAPSAFAPPEETLKIEETAPAPVVNGGGTIVDTVAALATTLAQYKFGTDTQRKWMYDQGITPQQANLGFDWINNIRKSGWIVQKGAYTAGVIFSTMGLQVQITSQPNLLLMANRFNNPWKMLIQNNILTYDSLLAAG
jgi:hypothetical protein